MTCNHVLLQAFDVVKMIEPFVQHCSDLPVSLRKHMQVETTTTFNLLKYMTVYTVAHTAAVWMHPH
jgi:hypothetical protein